jgi:D-beta-D-heptose 7-phosphate kinase/D-beta-D-heptose 1-phosphate adenosyltransferase
MKRIITKKRALEIIDNFSTSGVLVVGDIMVDQFIWGKVSRISPEAPVPVVEVTSETLLFGGCANVLKNISTIGGKVAVTGIIGSDNMGRWLIHRFRKMGIDIKGVIVEQDRPTIVKTRVIAQRQQVVRFDRENKNPVDPDNVQTMLEYIKSVKDELGAVVVSDYNKGMITKRLINGIRETISDTDIILCVDPKQSDFSFYSGCDIITPNHHEAGRALGIELRGDGDILKGGKALLEKYDFKAVLITRGEEGMTLFERNGDITNIPTVAKEVFDVTGAGDTVIGVFALCAAAGAQFREAAALANHAAGIVVGKVGTATVSQNELKNVL